MYHVLIAVFALAMLCGCSGGGSGGATLGAVGSAGGTVATKARDIAGSSAAVPAGALSGPVTITIAEGAIVASGAEAAVGPAVQFGPSGLQFSSPVTVTVPFSAALFPPGDGPADLFVDQREDATGTVTRRTPSSIDSIHGLVAVQTSSFSTFQAVVLPPTLSFSPPALDFATVAPGATEDLGCAVTNTGGGTLTGTATTVAPFSIVGSAVYRLGPGGSQAVTVRFSPPAAGAFSGSLSCSGGGGAVISLAGGSPNLSVAPPAIDFGTVAVGASADMSLTVSNAGGGTLAGTATTSAPFSIIGPATYNLGAGAGPSTA